MVRYYSKLPTDTFREKELVEGVYLDIDCSLHRLILEHDVHLHTDI